MTAHLTGRSLERVTPRHYTIKGPYKETSPTIHCDSHAREGRVVHTVLCAYIYIYIKKKIKHVSCEFDQFRGRYSSLQAALIPAHNFCFRVLEREWSVSEAYPGIKLLFTVDGRTCISSHSLFFYARGRRHVTHIHARVCSYYPSS